MIVGVLAGRTSIVSFCHLVAFIVSSSISLPLSVCKKPLSTLITVMMIQINIAMKMIAP